MSVDERGFVEWVDPVVAVEDVFLLLDAAAQQGSARVLIESALFPAAFFDLSTGFAGAVLQKLQNYGLVVGAVFPDDDGYSDRFKEFLREARRGPQFRAFARRDEAETWLAEGR